MGLHEMNSLPITDKLSGLLDAGKGLQKAILGQMKALRLNEVVKSFNMAPLVRPDVYP